jgi:plasmid stabilization system protein ParE
VGGTEKLVAVIQTHSAQMDIESVYVHIANEGGLSAADRVIDAILSTCGDLEQFPGMGRHRDELDMFGLRCEASGSAAT